MQLLRAVAREHSELFSEKDIEDHSANPPPFKDSVTYLGEILCSVLGEIFKENLRRNNRTVEPMLLAADHTVSFDYITHVLFCCMHQYCYSKLSLKTAKLIQNMRNSTESWSRKEPATLLLTSKI